MRQLKLVLICLIAPLLAFSQNKEPLSKRVGALGFVELNYNFADKLITPGLARRWTVAMSMTNKKRDFVAFLGLGIKGARINLYSPSIQKSFKQDVKDNYVLREGSFSDSLVANCVNDLANNRAGSFWGTYDQHWQAGIIWLKNKWCPTIVFTSGWESFCLFNRDFDQLDPVHHDYRFTTMNSFFNELKLGLSLKGKDMPFCLNLNLGFKYIDYGGIVFETTPLNKYTNNNLANKYGKNGKLTFSISCMFWSNWEND